MCEGCKCNSEERERKRQETFPPEVREVVQWLDNLVYVHVGDSEDSFARVFRKIIRERPKWLSVKTASIIVGAVMLEYDTPNYLGILIREQFEQEEEEEKGHKDQKNGDLGAADNLD